MELVLTGVNYRSAPVEIRERVALGGERLCAALDSTMQSAGVREAFILSTCARTEVLLCTDSPPGSGNPGPLADPEVLPHVYRHEGERSVRHLFRVVAGLDSFVVGEREILGQVRRAATIARECGAVGSVLDPVHREALRIGRAVRRETSLWSAPPSMADLVVEFLSRRLEGIGDPMIAVIGAGDLASRLCAALRRDLGCASIIVANRTFQRAKAIVRELGGEAMRFAELDERLPDVDAVICATDAPHPIFDTDRAERALRVREGRDLVLIDLAVPRDVTAEVSGLVGIDLYDIDDVISHLQSDRSRIAGAIAEGERMVREGAAATWRLLREREGALVVRRFREGLEEGSLDRFREALGGSEGGDPEEALRSVLRGLLHRPTVELRRALGSGRHNRVEEIFVLFGLDGG